jgi:IS4 transposase
MAGQRHHRQSELFFRWLKHGLHIRIFYSTTANAVRLQLWASICTYLAMAITPASSSALPQI